MSEKTFITTYATYSCEDFKGSENLSHDNYTFLMTRQELAEYFGQKSAVSGRKNADVETEDE